MDNGRRLPSGFPRHFGSAAREYHEGGQADYFELAWQYPTIVEVITAPAEKGCGILGGTVVHDDEHGELDYYHNGRYSGSWHHNWQGEETWTEYVKKSVEVTAQYIDAYVKRNGDSYWYVPIFVDQANATILRYGRGGR